MSYKNLIDTSLNRAFTLVKDLAEDAVLSSKSNIGFDFSTGNMTAATVENIPIKLVFTTDDKLSKEHNTVTREAILKTNVSLDLTSYDTITIGSAIWNISQIMKGNGYIRTVTLSKEA